jgi:hypothetical protein
MGYFFRGVAAGRRRLLDDGAGAVTRDGEAVADSFHRVLAAG